MMDDAGPQSLFVVVSYGYIGPYFSQIFLLEKNENNRDNSSCFPSKEERSKLKRSSSDPSLSPDTPLNLNSTSERLPKITRPLLTYSLDPQKDFVAHLSQEQVDPPVFFWKFCTPAISDEELCMVLDPGDFFYPSDVPMKGFILNLSSTSCKTIEPPMGSGFYKHVVALGGHIYFLTYFHFKRASLFTRYSPLDDSWEYLDPFPDFHVRATLLGSVALDDTIVLNIDDMFWAYNVFTNKWYEVDVRDRECYSMLGDAVVLENTIYALTETSRGVVLALSIEKKFYNVDLRYSCSLLYKIEVPGMGEDNFRYSGSQWLSRHLVHLGEYNFCLVRYAKFHEKHVDCQPYHVDWQPIQVTYMKLKKREKSMTVTDTLMYKVKILEEVQFNVQLCFSLPNHKAAALRKGSVLHVNPFREDYVPKRKEINQEAEVPPENADDVVNTNVEGHSIFVRNLPRDVDVAQVKKEVEKFGAIKRDGIQVFKSRKGKGKCAYVEFESEISKKCAIEASLVVIGGCSAEILERKTSEKKKKKREEMNRASC